MTMCSPGVMRGNASNATSALLLTKVRQKTFGSNMRQLRRTRRPSTNRTSTKKEVKFIGTTDSAEDEDAVYGKGVRMLLSGMTRGRSAQLVFDEQMRHRNTEDKKNIANVCKWMFCVKDPRTLGAKTLWMRWRTVANGRIGAMKNLMMCAVISGMIGAARKKTCIGRKLRMSGRKLPLVAGTLLQYASKAVLGVGAVTTVLGAGAVTTVLGVGAVRAFLPYGASITVRTLTKKSSHWFCPFFYRSELCSFGG